MGRPLPVAVANEGFWGSPTQNAVLVVTVGQGDNPRFSIQRWDEHPQYRELSLPSLKLTATFSPLKIGHPTPNRKGESIPTIGQIIIFHQPRFP